MKITINKTESSSEIKFPCLMTNECGFIALMFSWDSGVILQQADEYMSLSLPRYNSCPWLKDGWKPFKGTITLENE